MTPEKFAENFHLIRQEVGKILVGQEDVLNSLIVCLIARGHALVEGVPGLGKTLMIKSLAQVVDLSFSRIQFTPDLMPADITGTMVLEEELGRRSFRFQEGPVFANVILADEINRATPKTQSALLEAMQEGQVTVARQTHMLPQPFFVFATQNPIEMEGTYPLPEAQLDRFFLKILIDYPSDVEMTEVLSRTTGTYEPNPRKVVEGKDLLDMAALAREVPISRPVYEFVINLIEATRPQNNKSGETVRRYVRYGSSPRGAQALVLAAKVRALERGRFNVSLEDVQAVALPALRHRILLNFEAQAEGISPDAVIEDVLKRTAR
jgi:MoxR-like ATPase